MTADAMTLARPDILTNVRNYISLTKPRIIVLLLITTVPAMVVADRGWPGTWLVLATLIGGTLSAGGANAINCWYDRDIDSVMRRTQSRPLVTGAIEPVPVIVPKLSSVETMMALTTRFTRRWNSSASVSE